MKKLLWLPVTALIVLLPILAVLNMFAFAFPEWVMLISAGLLVAAGVLFIIFGEAKLRTKIVLPVVSVLVIAAGLLGSYCNPYWSSVSFRSAGFSRDYSTVLTAAQAEEDMEQMLSILCKDHPGFRKGIPAEFTAAYEESLARVKNDGEITVNDLYVYMQKALSSLGDGHTTAYPNYAQPRYPKTIAARKAEGLELSAVNGISMEQLFFANRDRFCFEASSWGMEMLRQHINSDWGLDFLGFDTDGVEYTWTDEAGNTVTDTHTSADFLTYDEYQQYNAQYAASSTDAPGSFVYYDIDKEKDLAVLTLTQCIYDSEYKTCLHDFFTEVKEQGIGNVAVDVRGNGGGNSLVVNEFIRYLDVDSYKVDGARLRLGVFELDLDMNNGTMENKRYDDLTYTGDVFLLTDAASFSSAMFFASYIKDNGLGTLIGEPPGNAPNGFGDVANFRLNNSGLYMSVSTKQFFRPDRECTDRLVMPDFECESSQAMGVLELIVAMEQVLGE